MPNIIQLLPDHVANQIAAGEVVQRPASAVKELLENSVDAGATEITLVIKEAGKSLIQVIDNGKGMSEVDIRLAFERHATSKISNAEDLFRIRTKGFRGEALASIAAVSQVEVVTKQEDEEVGRILKIEGSEVKACEPASAETGTNLMVKNLFFNIPARRNFLKSDSVEFKHVIDEFEHVALAHPDIHFILIHNQSEIMNLPDGNTRQRIQGIFGKKYNERLVPVEEYTDVVAVNGFVVKPEYAKKTRGDQFFFVNDRFVKNSYLHHAVSAAFEDLIPHGVHPGYFLFLEIEPHRIDVNIHPTKTEIKFDDEKAIYAILRSSIKHSLGQFNISPTLDFENEVNFNAPPIQKGQSIPKPTIQIDPNFNPFENEGFNTPKKNAPTRDFPIQKAGGQFQWTDLESHETAKPAVEEKNSEVCIQLNKTYILSPLKSGMAIIHQQRAHERILFEEYINMLDGGNAASQQLLFPLNLSFSPSDAPIILNHLDDLQILGFDIEPFGQAGVVVQGIPIHMKESEIEPSLERIIEDAKNHRDEFKNTPREQIAKNLAKSSAIKVGTPLEKEEMLHIIHQLFACSMPFMGINAKPTIVHIEGDELEKRFG